MSKNDFKAFAVGANANVMPQADWESLPALLSGFIAGKASSAEVNKALRQASFIAAALAQYTVNKSGQDVLDDGDLNGFITKMSSAFGKDYQALDATLTALAGLATGANKLPYFTDTDKAAQTDLTQVGRDIIGKTDIAAVLQYLGLGTAAKRNVDAGLINGIPDMASFRATVLPNGVFKIDVIGAGGGKQKLVFQWGIAATPNGSNNTYNVNEAFPNTILWASGNRGATGSNAGMGVSPEGTQQIRIQNYASGSGFENCLWWAIGW